MKTNELRDETMALLDHLSKYHAELLSLSVAPDKLRVAVATAIFGPDDLEVKKYVEQSFEVEDGYDIAFAIYLEYSVIVTLVIIFETQLLKLCDDLTRKRNLPIRAKDLRGDTSSQCRKYLEDLVGLPADSLDWTGILELLKIRNCIVHALGNVELSRDKKFLRTLDDENRVAVAGDQLFINGVYTVDSIELVRSFFDKLFYLVAGKKTRKERKPKSMTDSDTDQSSLALDQSD